MFSDEFKTKKYLQCIGKLYPVSGTLFYCNHRTFWEEEVVVVMVMVKGKQRAEEEIKKMRRQRPSSRSKIFTIGLL